MSAYLTALRCLPSYQILPMQIVCYDGVQGDFLIRPATNTSTDYPIGVSQTGYDVPPNLINALSSGTATYTPVAAQPGEELLVFTVGDIAPVVVGANITAGALVSFNSAGLAIMVAPGSNSYFAGIATQSSQGNTSGAVIDILIQPGKA
jgi:hypothetical protein